MPGVSRKTRGEIVSTPLLMGSGEGAEDDQSGEISRGNARQDAVTDRFAVQWPKGNRDDGFDTRGKHGVVATRAGWVVPGSAVKYQRCSHYGPPPVMPGRPVGDASKRLRGPGSRPISRSNRNDIPASR